MLREFAGTAFDPALVDLLIARLHSAPPPASVAPAESAWPAAEPLALQDIAGAHREEQTLYEIAQALGSSLGVSDAMALIQREGQPARSVHHVRAVPRRRRARATSAATRTVPGTEALFKWTPKSWSELSLRAPVVRRRPRSARRGSDVAAALSADVRRAAHRRPGRSITRSPGCFTDEHRRVLGRVSEQAAAVIYNSTRFEQTQHESHTDPLTGLPNRRSLDRQFEAGLARAARTRGSVSVVVLDLDRLKEINDTYGHEAGDRALRAVGNVLRATVRAERSLRAVRAATSSSSCCGTAARSTKRGACAELQNAVARASVRAASGRPRLAVDQRRRGTLSRRRHHVRRAAGGRRRADVPRQGGPALAELDQPSGSGATVTRRNPKTGEPTT